MQFSIDRNSPVPAYYQIQLDLSDRIQRGEWNDRKQLPSESTLAEQYAVSRITLRQALAELEKDGIIKKSRGCGAKICEKPAPFVHKMDFYSIVSTHEGHISASGICCTYQLPATVNRAGESAAYLFHRRIGSEFLFELCIDIR